MNSRTDRARRLFPLALGVVALVSAAVLTIDDADPRRFPVGSHDGLAAFSLAAIAMALMIFRIVQRAALAEMGKAIVLAAAFLFWAANQLWPDLPQAGMFNDIAIGLFVLDVFLAIAGRPSASSHDSPAESGRMNACRPTKSCGCCDWSSWNGDGVDDRASVAADVPEPVIRAGSPARQVE